MSPFYHAFAVFFPAGKSTFGALVNAEPAEKAVSYIYLREPPLLFAARGNRGFYNLDRAVRAGIGTDPTAYAFAFVKDLKASEPFGERAFHFRAQPGHAFFRDVFKRIFDVFENHTFKPPDRVQGPLPRQGSEGTGAGVSSSSYPLPGQS